MNPLPPEAFAASLAGFEEMTVHRLRALLRHHSPAEAWEVVQGRHPSRGLVERVMGEPKVRAAWAASAVARPPEQVWARCGELGVSVLLHGSAAFPAALADDPLPPPVLFAAGDLGLLDGRRVAVVGTRNATAAGRQAATRLGADLATAGVHVVSGLARGIDGAVHRGVLSAAADGRPIGVVACGLDVVYPREHQRLWAAVADTGLLLSECPPGVTPVPYRFPLRNRIVAGLAELVVVVESRERGGSLVTVAAALDRGVPVMAVPGSAVNRAARGVNELLRDGAAPVLDADDVLLALQMSPAARGASAELRPRPTPADVVVYRALQHRPLTLDGVADGVGLPLVDAAMSLARLSAAGWVAGADGWFECIGSPLP
jgi:DNA processing protein